jgi:hypothetical protein
MSDIFDEIKRTPVDPIALGASTKEYEHGVVAFDLLREASQWSIALGNVMPSEADAWSLTEAVIGGHFVRLAKLLRAFLQQTRDSYAELAWVTSRLVAECVINAMYLMAHPTGQVIRSYLFQSLYHDRELLETIQRNTEARGGEQLPIEERMLASIDRTFTNVGMLPEDVPAKRVQNWDGKTLRQKAESLGMAVVYQVSIGAVSRNVHGSWSDLTQHHLTVLEPGRFQPRFDEVRVRPQLILAMALLAVVACREYLRHLDDAGTADLQERTNELERRIRAADVLHEEFVIARRVARSNDR